MDKNNQASLAVAVVCLPDRGGDALVAYRLDEQANGRRWVDADVEVLVDHRHATQTGPRWSAVWTGRQ
jgi:hypothetical protein